MPKFMGKIGFMVTEETKPGVFTEQIVTKEYPGDINRRITRYENSSNLNDNIRLNAQVSIVADAYAYSNFHTIRFIEHFGTRWKVESVDASQPPRLILEIGGVYNG